ncbi:hypothetical protein BDW22DRAFT_765083 [Trametopsis cervina]|nr:hypothetical protein BDW22DRAFT_765083 [Trametopsis cervina]
MRSTLSFDTMLGLWNSSHSNYFTPHSTVLPILFLLPTTLLFSILLFLHHTAQQKTVRMITKRVTARPCIQRRVGIRGGTGRRDRDEATGDARPRCG